MSYKLLNSVILTCFFSAIFACPSSSRADQEDELLDLDLEQLMQVEMVSSASRYEQSTLEAPASVTIVTRNEIELLGYRTVSELLRGVRGFYTTDDRNYNYTGSRGFGRPADYDTRLLVLVNGHRMNDGVYDSSPLGLDLVVDIDLIDRVEVVRGPSSSLYGTNAFFGVINIITRSADDIDGIEASTSAGRFDTYKGNSSIGHVFENGTELVLSATRFDSEGENDIFFEEYSDDPSSRGLARDLDSEEGVNVFGQLSTETFTLEGGYVERSKRVPTAAYDTVFNNNDFEVDDERFYLDLTYADTISEGYDLELRTFYDWYSYLGDFPYDYSEEGDGSFLVTNRATARGERWGINAQTIISAVEHHKFVVGGEVRDNFNVDQEVFDVDPFFEYLNDHRDSTTWGIYAQDEVALLDDLILQAGARYDKYEDFDGEVSPRVALIWGLADSTALKFLFGKAFRAPNAFELYYNDNGISLKNNEDLEPEDIYTYEVILEHQFNKNYRVALDSYWYEIKNLISQEIDPADDLGIFNNLDEVEAYGLEGEFEGRWSGGWRFLTSYAFQETEDQLSGSHLSNSPRHLWKNQLIAPLYLEKLFAGVELLYTSDRRTLTGAEVDNYWLTNLTLTYRELFDSLSLSGSLYNAFDEDYRDPGSTEHPSDTIPQYGRTWRVKLTYNF